MRWTGEQAPPPLPPPRKRIRFPAEILLIESREGCGPLELSRGRRGRMPLRATLSQIPLKSCGFPGAESARKRFFLRGGKLPSEKISTIPPHRSPGSIGSREGSHPLELSETVLARILVSDDAGAILLNAFVSDDAGRGALRSPTHPRVTGCERGATLSRSSGGALAGTCFSDDTGAVLLTAFVFDDAGCF